MEQLILSDLMKLEPFTQGRLLDVLCTNTMPIESITIMDIANFDEWAKPYEAVIIGRFFQADEVITETFLRRLSEKLCPVIITKEKFTSSITAHMRERASRYKLPILVMPDQYSWSDLMSPVFKEIVSLQRKKLAFENRLMQIIVKQLLATPQVEDTANALTGLMECPLALLSKNKELVSTSDNWDWSLTKDIWQRERPSQFGVTLSGKPILSYPYPSKRRDLQLIFYPIEGGGFLLNSLVLVLPAKTTSLSPQIETCITLLCDVFRLKTMLYRQAYKTHNEFKELFLQKLINGEPFLAQDYLMYEQSTKAALFDSYTCCVFSVQDIEALKNYSENKLAIPITKRVDTILESGLGYKLSDVYPAYKELTFEYQGYFYILIPGKKTPSKAALKELHNELEYLFNIHLVYMGTCGPQPFSNMKECIQRAQEAHSVALQLGSTERFQSYEKLGFIRLLIQKDGQLNTAFSNELMKSFVEPLQLWDAKHKSELLRTIRMYIKQNCSIKTTAQALNIHVNTLRARFERIEELLGIDLNNVDDLLTLQLALKLEQERLRLKL